MLLTNHAERRSQQRGISHEVMQVIMKYGRSSEAPGNTCKLFFGNKEYSSVVREFKKIMKTLERAKGGTIILGGDRIITVYKQG